jgi:hypothetical protein
MDLRNQREMRIDSGKCAEGRICAGGSKYVLYQIVSVNIIFFKFNCITLKVGLKIHKLPLCFLVYV